MKNIQINSKKIQINESCHIYDDGEIFSVDIDIATWIEVNYCFIGKKNEEKVSHSRHITISKDSTFHGTCIIIDNTDIQIISEIVGDNTKSNLNILALATNSTVISVEGVAKVASPYRQVFTRVDQTNILIWKGSRVRWVPRLEINTDDIEGGHSCRIHRLGGESLFYLTSRGLSEKNAETLLLNSEILRHLKTIEPSERENTCHEIHMRLAWKNL